LKVFFFLFRENPCESVAKTKTSVFSSVIFVSVIFVITYAHGIEYLD